MRKHVIILTVVVLNVLFTICGHAFLQKDLDPIQVQVTALHDEVTNSKGHTLRLNVDALFDDESIQRVPAPKNTQIGDVVTVYAHDGGYTQNHRVPSNEFIWLFWQVSFAMSCILAFLVVAGIVTVGVDMLFDESTDERKPSYA